MDLKSGLMERWNPSDYYVMASSLFHAILTHHMLTLAIDTSTEQGSVALGENGKVLQIQEFRGSMRHSSTLFPALSQLKITALKIDRIIVGLGPGSFSGIRVSLAAAQGIACAQGGSVVGLCSAWSVALQYPAIDRLAVFADARRGEYYCTTFSHGRLTRPTFLFPGQHLSTEIGKYTLSVSAEALPGLAHRAHPRASDYLTLDPDSELFIRGPLLEPIYLRDPIPSAR